MKTALMISAALGLSVLAAPAFAQNTASASATASATIIQPISITNGGNLSFGRIVASATGGTVTLTAAATPTRSNTGGTTLVSGGTLSAAKFNVAGDASRTYSIAVSGLTQLTGQQDGAHVMPIALSTSSATGTLGAAGTDSFYVGGTLTVAANQAPDSYTGTLTATVTYN